MIDSSDNMIDSSDNMNSLLPWGEFFIPARAFKKAYELPGDENTVSSRELVSRSRKLIFDSLTKLKNSNELIAGYQKMNTVINKQPLKVQITSGCPGKILNEEHPEKTNGKNGMKNTNGNPSKYKPHIPIDLNEPAEVRFWCRKLNISSGELAGAIARSGSNIASDVIDFITLQANIRQTA